MIAFALTTLVLCLVVLMALAVYDSTPDPYEED